MTEAIKSLIWNHGEHTINGKKVYKYLIGAILVTDQPIEGMGEGDNIGMAEIPTDLNMFTNAFTSIPKYKSPYTFGDLSRAIIEISEMNPNDLIPRKKSKE